MITVKHILRPLLLVAALSMASCVSPRIPDPLQAQFGPTLMQKSPGGYELTNRKLAAHIDEQTGAIALFRLGSPAPAGVSPTFEPAAASSPQGGYIESRDEETWQYFGTSKDGRLGWRIVCCLHVNELEVSYIVQNKTAEPITGYVRLPAPPGVKIESFDEDPSLSGPRPDGSVRADERTLAPNERINFATRWTIP